MQCYMLTESVEYVGRHSKVKGKVRSSEDIVGPANRVILQVDQPDQQHTRRQLMYILLQD